MFQQFLKDKNLNPTHISLYLALFQIWNSNRFANEFFVNREEVMSFSKIGSKSTYHKCIKELSHWKYIIYYPSHNPFKGSKIKMLKFQTSCRQVEEHNSPKNGTSNGQAVVSNINSIKHIKDIKKALPNSIHQVITFFLKNEWPKIEAEKFHSYYESLNWKIKGKTKIVNWQAAAKSWMLKSQEFHKIPKEKQTNIKVSKNKNYNEPL
ncbi:hypothetical protein [Xanthomarina gelatinilytica]|uniref:hypothetical protein n=1 Tax=Xanthomarina gelatinilytica TaxID=1137281 RepID=UPI003AA948DB